MFFLFNVAEHWTPKTCQHLYNVLFHHEQTACVSLLNVQPCIQDVSRACWINPIIYFRICFHPQQHMNCHTKLTGFDNIPGALETYCMCWRGPLEIKGFFWSSLVRVIFVEPPIEKRLCIVQFLFSILFAFILLVKWKCTCLANEKNTIYMNNILTDIALIYYSYVVLFCCCISYIAVSCIASVSMLAIACHR